MSDARARVLCAIHEALGDPRARMLAEPEVAPLAEPDEDTPALAARFSRELAALQGVATVVHDRATCAVAVAAYLMERNARSIASQSAPLAADIARRLSGFEISPAAERSKNELARVDCGLLEARSLVADIGAAVLLLENGADRVLPYLPRTCVIVAELGSLHSTLSRQAMNPIYDAAIGGREGEALIVAGPSRTADIEKTLVLGAHGPQAVAVFIIEQA